MATVPQTAPTNLQVRPRYGALPDGTPVEPIAHPLYSTVYVPAANLPSELVFFNYGIGDYVPGAGTSIVAKSYHTNMDQGGRLAQPRHQLITGVRVFMNPLIVSSAGAVTIQANFSATGTAGYASDTNFEDIVYITQTGVLTIDHNQKTIVEQPVALAPGNYGFEGVANVDMDSAEAFGATNVYRKYDFSMVGSRGVPQTFGDRAFLLKPNESFEVKISYPQPRDGSTPTMLAGSGRYVTVILDGQQLRARR